ncbi:MAG TPA: polyprenyl diphosphate synthase [Gemmatimonadota bacterium]|nr:polyprenyl diphosphate synthase [Gemmatimonadota bacterium]
MTDRTTGGTDLMAEIRAAGDVPRHVAIIMDGNGRWAAERDLPRWHGHREGMRSVRTAVETALELGLEHLTLYAFSRENWSRPPEEVGALMRLLAEFVDREREELREQGVRTRVFGDRERLPPKALASVERLESTTADGTELQLNVAISYGARDEITHAARRLAELAVDGRLDPAQLTPADIEAHLYTAGWPDPDLLVRTSGEMRISNFLLWQIAYAEIYVTPVLWPDFGRDEFLAGVRDFQRRDRRFGRVAT